MGCAGAPLDSPNAEPVSSKAVANTRLATAVPGQVLKASKHGDTHHSHHSWCPALGLFHHQRQKFLTLSPNLPSCKWWFCKTVPLESEYLEQQFVWEGIFGGHLQFSRKQTNKQNPSRIKINPRSITLPSRFVGPLCRAIARQPLGMQPAREGGRGERQPFPPAPTCPSFPHCVNLL